MLWLFQFALNESLGISIPGGKAAFGGRLPLRATAPQDSLRTLRSEGRLTAGLKRPAPAPAQRHHVIEVQHLAQDQHRQHGALNSNLDRTPDVGCIECLMHAYVARARHVLSLLKKICFISHANVWGSNMR